MDTGSLLKSLLNIAGYTQKDFAGMIFISPSTFSKIINGKHQIKSVDTIPFSANCARILAQEIYEHNCYYKLGEIFPVICKFSSRQNLEHFFFRAFQYVINQDNERADENRLPKSSSQHFVGTKEVLYMYCIINSDYLQNETGKDEALEFYSTVPRLFGEYAKFMDQVLVLPPELSKKVRYNQFFNPAQCKNWAKEYSTNIIATIYQMAQHLDLYFCRSKVLSDTPFQLLKGKYIILYSQQLDGTISMTLIRDAYELERLEEHIQQMLDGAELRSFTQDNIDEYFTENKNKKYQVKRKAELLVKLNGTHSIDVHAITAWLKFFFAELKKNDCSIYICSDLLHSFLFDNLIFVPQITKLDLSMSERIDILNLIKNHSREKDSSIHVVNAPLDSLIVECSDEMSLLCLFDPVHEKAKYHFFASDILRPGLRALVKDEINSTADFIERMIHQVVV